MGLPESSFVDFIYTFTHSSVYPFPLHQIGISEAVTVPCLIEVASRRISSQ